MQKMDQKNITRDVAITMSGVIRDAHAWKWGLFGVVKFENKNLRTTTFIISLPFGFCVHLGIGREINDESL